MVVNILPFDTLQEQRTNDSQFTNIRKKNDKLNLTHL